MSADTRGNGFEYATSVTVQESGASYSARVHPKWTVGGRPNGGYLQAIMARAAVAAVGCANTGPIHPLSVNATFLRSPVPGPAEIRTEVVRRGRTVSQVRARLVQKDCVQVEAMVGVGRFDHGGSPYWCAVQTVEVPAEEECVLLPSGELSGEPIALFEVVHERLDPQVLNWSRDARDGSAELRGWLRLADGRDHDPFSLLLALDAFPPAIFALGVRGWVPTISLTAYVRSLPAPGPLRIRQRATLMHAGLMDGVCEAWDSDGRLVGQATQLAAVRLRDPSEI